MKRLQWRKILALIAGCLVIAGITPIAFSFWSVFATPPKPLIVQFPTKAGVYTSPPFNTTLFEPIRFDLEFARMPATRTWLDLDWKIVDDHGSVITEIPYHYWIVENQFHLGGYAKGYRKGQRMVLTLPRDIQGIDENMQLKISEDVDEIGLDMSYAYLLLVGFAVIVSGSGVLIFLGLCIWRTPRPSP